jgi:hypothetical protein
VASTASAAATSGYLGGSSARECDSRGEEQRRGRGAGGGGRGLGGCCGDAAASPAKRGVAGGVWAVGWGTSGAGSVWAGLASSGRLHGQEGSSDWTGGGGRGGARMMRGREEAEGREWTVARV